MGTKQQVPCKPAIPVYIVSSARIFRQSSSGGIACDSLHRVGYVHTGQSRVRAQQRRLGWETAHPRLFTAMPDPALHCLLHDKPPNNSMLSKTVFGIQNRGVCPVYMSWVYSCDRPL